MLSSGDRYAYVTNFSSISSYTVNSDGSLTLLNALADNTIGDGGGDEATSQDGRFLYAQNLITGTLLAFRIEQDGSLVLLQTVTGLPPNGIGVVAQ